MNVLDDVEQCRHMQATLRDYRAKSWAIGLAWPVGRPDSIFAFFNQRHLACQCYLRGEISAGDPSAYDADICTLQAYIERIAPAEMEACDRMLAKLKEHKARGWAIGLTYTGNHQPDTFTRFLDYRGLPSAYYVRSPDLSVGSPEAYDIDAHAIESYKARLSRLLDAD